MHWGHLLPGGGGRVLRTHQEAGGLSRGCLHTHTWPGFVFLPTVGTVPSGLALGPGTVTLQPCTPDSGASWKGHARRRAGRRWRTGPPAGWPCGQCRRRSTATGCWLRGGSWPKVGTVGKSRSVRSACLRGGRQLPSAGRGTWRSCSPEPPGWGRALGLAGWATEMGSRHHS